MDGDITKALILHFPVDSEPLKYVFGKEGTFQGAMKQSKQRSSINLTVYYIDNAADEEQEGPNKYREMYSTQLDLLQQMWSAVPCHQFKISAKDFVQISPILQTYEKRTKSFGSQMITTFITSTDFYKHPLLTLLESNEGKLHYIGSWLMDSEKTLLMSGSLTNAPVGDDDAILNEMNKVIYRWKQNVIEMNPNNDSGLTIVIASDVTHNLESKLIKMMDVKENAGLQDSGFDVVYVEHPILYGVNLLIETQRKKAIEAELERQMKAKKKAEEAKRAIAEAAEAKRIAEKERKKKEKEAEKARKKEKAALEAEQKRKAEKDNDEIGIEKGKKRKTEKDNLKSLKSKNGNDKEKIEKDSASKKQALYKSYLKTKIAKEFDDGMVYFGTVEEYFDEDVPVWNVVYEDGDGEDMEEDELRHSIRLFKKIAQKKLSSGVKVFTPNK